MLKKMITRKILIASLALFALTLYYVLPEDTKTLNNIEQELEYVDKSVNTNNIYLLDSNNYLALTEIAVENSEVKELAKELLEILIKDGVGESKIPSGFKSLISSDTKILNVEYDKNILKVDFSKELLDCAKEYEEKIIESIVFTLTSINNVDKVIIYKEGEILTKLPLNNIILPTTFDKTYGINKRYDIDKLKNVVGVTVYYINKYNDNYYYVPVTHYLNDERDKISIIIDELSNEFDYTGNLMSFMNEDVKLISSNIEDKTMMLEFNSAILNDFNEMSILEEVIYTVTLSIKDNYDIEEVVFLVENEEIYKKTLNN